MIKPAAPANQVEREFAAAHANALEAVGNVTKYVSPLLARQIEALEARIAPDRAEAIKEYVFLYGV